MDFGSSDLLGVNCSEPGFMGFNDLWDYGGWVWIG